MLAESKFAQYLIYALGEIVLVVIGILIALSINNWNGQRKDRNAEQQVLSLILSDLIANEEILATAETKIDKQIDQTIRILELMHTNPADSLMGNAKRLLHHGTEVEDIQLNLAGIQSAINNRIELVTNDSIKRSLISYPVYVNGYKEQEHLMKAITTERIRPKIKSHILLENVNNESTKFSSDYRGMLSDRSLANDFTDRKWESGEWKSDLLDLRSHGQNLIRLIEQELNSNQ